MSPSRREFLRTGTVFAAGAALPVSLFRGRARPTPAEFDEATVRALATRALEAATAAGALHAEVRLSAYKQWSMGAWNSLMGIAGLSAPGMHSARRDELAIGVRALVGGSWGFASGPIWSLEEAARLGAQAVQQGRTTGRPGAAPIELVPAPAVPAGHWAMPIGRDPFKVPRTEVLDVLLGTGYFTLRRWGAPTPMVELVRLETAFASTAGSFLTQVRHQTGGTISITVRPTYRDHQFEGHRPGHAARVLPLAGMGWEYLAGAPWHEMTERLIAEQEEALTLPVKAVEVGRYDVLFDPSTTARLLSGTIGTATELDRALGFEANAGGTTYLSDPVGMLGREPIGGLALQVTANRSLPGGLATVKWDDEGVEPEDFTLVKDGILDDFQTTRDTAPWLREGYTRLGRPLRSHGCAGGATALDATQLQRPNLRLAAGTERADMNEMMARMGNGIVVEEAMPDIDFNALNGMVRLDPEFPYGRFYEVKRGRKVARLVPEATGVLFRAPELWKSVLALGGAGSVRRTAVRALKGEPSQMTWHTVEAPPMLCRQLAVIDPTR